MNKEIRMLNPNYLKDLNDNGQAQDTAPALNDLLTQNML